MINGYTILDGAKYFVEDGLQNYSIFQSSFIPITNDVVTKWISKGLSNENTKPPAITTDKIFETNSSFHVK